MTDNQRIAYEWAKSHDYPSIAARYARELAGLVDDLQAAYDDMAGDLELRTKQVRQLQEKNAVLRGRNGRNEPLTLDELRKMDGEPVWTVATGVSGSGRLELCTCETVCACPLHKVLRCVTADGEVTDYNLDTYGKTYLVYHQKPEEVQK